MVQTDSDSGASEALLLDRASRRVFRSGKVVPLTPREFDLLVYLTDNRGKACSRGELLAAVWGSDPRYLSISTVTVHMRRLRLKLEADPDAPVLLVTVRGHGYRYDRPYAVPAIMDGTDPAQTDLSQSDAVRSDLLLNVLDGWDFRPAARIAIDLMRQRGSIQAVADAVLVPAVDQMRTRVAEGTASPIDERLLTSMLHCVLTAMSLESNALPIQGKIVLTCTAAASQGFTTRLVGEILRERGWFTSFIAQPAPMTGLSSFLDDRGPNAFVIACASSSDIPAVARMIGVARALGILVIAGGDGLLDERQAARIGAFGWASSADEVIGVLLTIQERPARPLEAFAELSASGTSLDLRADAIASRVTQVLAGEGSGLAGAESFGRTQRQISTLLRTVAAGLMLDDISVVHRHVVQMQGAHRREGELALLLRTVAQTLAAEGYVEGGRMLEPESAGTAA